MVLGMPYDIQGSATYSILPAVSPKPISDMSVFDWGCMPSCGNTLTLNAKVVIYYN